MDHTATISELITRLQQLKKDFGDLPVYHQSTGGIVDGIYLDLIKVVEPEEDEYYPHEKSIYIP